MKKKKKKWMKSTSIRFDPDKLQKAKEMKVFQNLPDKCRESLDELIKDRK